MGLFVRRSETGTHAPLYTTGASKTVVLVGLGNPGKEYKNTRHNIGFEVLDAFVKDWDMGSWTAKKDLKCELATGVANGVKIIAVKPTTFMNNSGEALQAVLHFYKKSAADVLVIHDELDIAFGKIRTTKEGSAAGHNGVKSIISVLGEEFARVRIGIGPKKPAAIDSADFVLAQFSATQKKQLPLIIADAVSIANDFIASGELYIETRNTIL